MRKIICAMQVSLDGVIEGIDGDIGWIPSWEDHFGLTPRIDLCVMGAGMYPGYEFYWSAIAKEGRAPEAFGGGAVTAGERAYASFAVRTPHIVLSSKSDGAAWPRTRFVRDVEAIARIKSEPGKDIYAVGGARFIATLLNHRLIDELMLLVHPIVLGGGKKLFDHVDRRSELEFKSSTNMAGGLVRLDYGVRAAP